MGGEENELKGLLGLPEGERELDDLTKFNTTHNKRILTLTTEVGASNIQTPKRKRKNSRVTFSEDNEIINPEDVDPTFGHFQNRGRTMMVPSKRQRIEVPGSWGLKEFGRPTYTFSGGLYGGLPPPQNEASVQPHSVHRSEFIGQLPTLYANLVPDADLTPVAPSVVNMNPTATPAVHHPEAGNQLKKKYAKEVWPHLPD
ncbi:nuclear inhibitor of protein phosphatase 1-like [Perognathus longimembris pacificus]|uniref:nuclear inhibitor of protein phosphatase 1-like n=1 Tax=Perognathus longimembris pacificus TaxID=214514 RepID=UPI0020197DDC|nr:nuclear inhibitor of protein phosphatase 1-like [Perognathus longimembris pacificus]